MSTFLKILLGALLISILAYFCFMDKALGIKGDLTSKAQAAFHAKDMDWIDTSVKGDDLGLTRTLVLEGNAPSDALKAEAGRIAYAQEGIYSVDNQLVVSQALAATPDTTTQMAPLAVEPVQAATQAPEVTTQSPYTFMAQKDKEGKVTLQGYLPDVQTHEKIITQAHNDFGKENVIDELKEADGAPESWFTSARLGLSALAQTTYGKVTMEDTAYDFEGDVLAATQKEGILQAFKDDLSSNYTGHYAINAPKPIAPVVAAGNATQEVAAVESTPKPQATATNCQDEFDKILSNQKIHFAYNKAIIKTDSFGLLDNLVDASKHCESAIISIGGHTDSIGSKEYNQQLSEKRAKSVKAYLVKKGINADNLKAIGYGEVHPIADNMVKEGRAKNRRIEFTIKGAE